MSFIKPSITSDEVAKAMLDGLTDRIRKELKERIVKSIEPDINAAVDAALESFKVAIKAHHDDCYMQDTIRVLVERR